MRPAVLAATTFGLGRWPWGPGTFTSAAVALAAHLVGPPPLAALLAVGALLAFAGVGWAGAAERDLGPDAPAITIDEAAGMLLALAFAPPTPAGSVTAFVAFRAFDIVKPPPARALHRLRGGVGVVADDVVAALYAGALLSLLRLLRLPWLADLS